ncbi:MAG: hypothetical protein IJ523_09835 [Succinivibrionaceae bacterium]|nr:hypothetical protein [Succinivibrionaceae bacterium]
MPDENIKNAPAADDRNAPCEAGCDKDGSGITASDGPGGNPIDAADGQSEDELMRELEDIEKDERFQQACEAQVLLIYGQEYVEELDCQP